MGFESYFNAIKNSTQEIEHMMHKVYGIPSSRPIGDNIMDKITKIPSYYFHHADTHLIVNPHSGFLRFLYDPERNVIRLPENNFILHGDRIHIFRTWAVWDDIYPMIEFINRAYEVTGRKIVFHIPRSTDKVSRNYIEESIKIVQQQSCVDICKVYNERDGIIHRFNMGDKVVEVRSMFNHRYRMKVYKKGEIKNNGTITSKNDINNKLFES